MLTVIVAVPPMPAMLMVRFDVDPVPLMVKPTLLVIVPRLMADPAEPAPAALFSPTLRIEVTVRVLPWTVIFPVKELASLESRQSPPPAGWVTEIVPFPLEIRPVTSVVFVGFAPRP